MLRRSPPLASSPARGQSARASSRDQRRRARRGPTSRHLGLAAEQPSGSSPAPLRAARCSCSPSAADRVSEAGRSALIPSDAGPAGAHVARHRVGAAGRAELAQDVLDVVLDRPLADDQRRGDREVGLAPGQQPQHLELARRSAHRPAPGSAGAGGGPPSSAASARELAEAIAHPLDRRLQLVVMELQRLAQHGPLEHARPAPRCSCDATSASSASSARPLAKHRRAAAPPSCPRTVSAATT